MRDGVYENVYVARQPTGNTHEDVDALFGSARVDLKDEHWFT